MSIQFSAQMQSNANFAIQQQAIRMQEANNFRIGGCIRPRPGRPGGCFPSPWGTDHHRNLPDQNVGPRWWNGSPFGRSNKGYVIDTNNNGRYDRGRDGVLVFDQNRDGKYDMSDVSSTNDMMKAAAGNYDFNNDGRVCRCERIRGSILRRQFQRLDRNRNGKLDTWEISAGGGKVWVDKSRGGGISRDELHSPYRIPGRFGGTRRLDHVDPVWGSRTSRNRPWWNRPCPGLPRFPRPFPLPRPCPFPGPIGHHC